jgi:hypothetical protein
MEFRSVNPSVDKVAYKPADFSTAPEERDHKCTWPAIGGTISLSSAQSTAYSDPAHQDENEEDDDDQTESAGRIVAPAAAVRPGRESTDEDQNQNN